MGLSVLYYLLESQSPDDLAAGHLNIPDHPEVF